MEARQRFAMARLMSAASARGHAAVHHLFQAGGPVLVEVRYPGAIYSSDWHLCETVDEFDGLVEKMSADAVLHVSRVWDLSNQAGAVCLRR
jgi:hypothetical protein